MVTKKMKTYSEKRPWGSFEKFCENEKCTVKILFIKPKQELSLQTHNHRDEFWKIFQGKPKIELGDKVIKAKENDEFFIPKNIKHRASAGAKSVKILEISFGKFDEKDEIRLEDKYERD
jgi:mannose-1-phosphate guanylyltransferase